MNTKILIPVMLAVLAVSAGYVLFEGADSSDAATGTHTDTVTNLYTFDVVGGEAIIVSFTGSDATEINIPSTVSDGTNTYNVTVLGNGTDAIVARNQISVTKATLTIPNGIITISDKAFFDTSGSASKYKGTLTIPDSVTTIGANAFYTGFAGFDTLILGNNVSSIGDQAFCYSGGFTGTLTIPDSVDTIGTMAFFNCSGFTNIVFGTGLTTIPASCFMGCTSLATVDIPETIDSVGNQAFNNCSSVTDLIIRGTPQTIGTNAFNMTALETVYNLGSNESIVAGAYGIPSTATVSRTMQTFTYEIVDGYATITGTTGEDWTDVTIPSIVTSGGVEYTVTTIGANNAPIISSGQLAEGATLTIPEGITAINTNAFNGLSGLTGSLVLPSSLTSIGTQAFNQCTGFTGTLTIPASADVLRETFKGCSGFTALVIEEGVSFIGPGAFSQCTGLTGALALPASLTSISSSAFSNCSGLTALDLEDVSSIGDNAFYGDAGLTGVLILNENISSVGNFAFNYTGYDGLVIVGTPTIAATAFNYTSIKQVLNLGDNEVTATSYGLNADEVREDIPAYGIIAPASVTEEIENEGAVYDLVAILPILIVATLTLMIVAYAIRARLS